MAPAARRSPALLWSSAACLTAAGLLASTATASTSAAVTLGAVAAAATAVVTAAAALRTGGAARLMWTLITGALALAAVSIAGTASVTLVPEGATWIGVDLLLLAAGLVALRASRADRDRAAVVDGVIVVIAAGLLASHFVLAPILGGVGATSAPAAITATVGDVALIGLAVRLWFSTQTASRRATRWTAIALLILALADLGSLAGSRSPELAIGPMNAVAALAALAALWLLGLAALDPSRCDLTPSSESTNLRSPLRTLIMLALALAAPAVVWVSDLRRGGDADSPLLVPLAVALLALVVTRVLMLVRAYERASARNTVSREVGLALLSEPTPSQAQLDAWVADVTGRSDLRAQLLAHGQTWPVEAGTLTRFATGEADMPELAVLSNRPLRRHLEEPLTALARALGSALERAHLRRSLINLEVGARTSQLLENTADAIVVLDADLVVHYATPALAQFTGSVTPTPGTPLTHLLPAGACATLSSLVLRSMDGGQPRSSLTLDTGGPVLSLDAVAVWIPEEGSAVLTLRDVTEHHALRAQLAQRAFYDPLTGLANRDLFRDRLGHAISRFERTGSAFSVMTLDLDDFKSVNDTLGHPTGDQLLCTVADRLREELRTIDTAARLGGDEFSIILDGADSVATAGMVADRILARLAEPIRVDEREIIPIASIGIATCHDGATATEIQRNADLALYEAKGAGKGRWNAFREQLHEEAVRRLNLTTELREALPAGEVLPWYQPIVELDTGRIVGLEALARWESPSQGLVSPAVFIPVAEESGLIVELGELMLRRSLTDLARIQREHPDLTGLRMSVNLSPRQLLQSDIVAMVADALGDSGIHPSQLVLELTESTLLPDGGIPVERFAALRALGVRLYIDDFGTGWSSLSYLRSLPVSGLKLAREFVQHLPNPSDLSLVTAVQDLSRSLALDDVVAEGIETAEQRDALLACGYRLGQGFLFDRPAPIGSLLGRLRGARSSSWDQAPLPASAGGAASSAAG